MYFWRLETSRMPEREPFEARIFSKISKVSKKMHHLMSETREKVNIYFFVTKSTIIKNSSNFKHSIAFEWILKKCIFSNLIFERFAFHENWELRICHQVVKFVARIRATLSDCGAFSLFVVHPQTVIRFDQNDEKVERRCLSPNACLWSVEECGFG